MVSTTQEGNGAFCQYFVVEIFGDNEEMLECPINHNLALEATLAIYSMSLKSYPQATMPTPHPPILTLLQLVQSTPCEQSNDELIINFSCCIICTLEEYMTIMQ